MKPLEIYIHIPFCMQKCRYCDFLSYAASDEVKEKYFTALLKEIAYYSKDFTSYEVDTVFIGGGTPSCVDVKWIEKIMACIKSGFHCNTDWEVSIEANPGTVSENKLERYLSAGVNRISFGLQSTDNEELKMLGRIHTYEDFEEGFMMARKAGFMNINVDIMSALPNQNIKSYRKTLEKVVKLNPEHISAYSLILEEETDFYRNLEVIEPALPSEDEEREMYVYTKEFLAGHGYDRYEISNYAKSGCECRHNVGYWRRTDYVGFGLGASSCVENIRFSNVADMTMYLENISVENWKSIRENTVSLTREEQMEETMFLGLRMTDGVDCKEFANQYGCPLAEVYGEVLQKGLREGTITVADKVALTDKGLDVSNYVMAQFLF